MDDGGPHGLMREITQAIDQYCDCEVDGTLCEFCCDGARTIGAIIATRLRAILALDVYREREAALEALCVELEGA